MNRDLTAALDEWTARGGSRIGQIVIERRADGFTLRHVEDLNADGLRKFTHATDARALANSDCAGAFRPLKTTRDLIRGWRMDLPNAAALRTALDYFYPAMTGVWLSWAQKELDPVPLRATLGRQTGMYRVTQKLTDEQARELVDSFCAQCLKCRLWDDQRPLPAPDEMPLLCHEACNLLVAEARKVVKAAP